MPIATTSGATSPGGTTPGASAPTRKRGEALVDAVHAAALAEIAENGVRGASMDRIAQRASTGKAALYRRWPNVRALALDLFLSTLQDAVADDFPNTGSLRDDLVTSMDRFVDAVQGPLGIVLRELISEAAHDPALVSEFQERFGLPQQAQVIAALQRAMARGEIPAQAIDPYLLEIPEAMVIHRMLLTGAPPSPGECTHLIDSVIMPLLRAPRPA